MRNTARRVAARFVQGLRGKIVPRDGGQPRETFAMRGAFRQYLSLDPGGRERGCMARTEKDKMLAGELYDANAPEVQADQAATHRWLARYNAALDMEPSDRRELLVERFAAVGEGTVIRPPFHCDYGFNISLGAGVFLNFNCVILDVVEVTIGDRTQIGPGVQILTADHPRDAAGRAAGLEFGRPVRIGRNVWIGGGAIILPGVSIDDGAVIGAGSVVTRDVPAGVTAFGNPARAQMIRRLGRDERG
jgi:maltose O-acetyltransferase